MHKLNKPSLMDDDDEDLADISSGSNRFLKTYKQEPRPKDKFQLELESKVKQRNKSDQGFEKADEDSNRFIKRDNQNIKRVGPVRTPTPRSIATDSDIGEDSGAESLKFSGSKTTGMGDTSWQPGIKKSPRSTLFDDYKTDNFNSNSHISMFDRNSFNDDIPKGDKLPVKSPRDSKKDDSMTDFSNKWNKPYQNIDDKKKNRMYNDDENDDLPFGKSKPKFEVKKKNRMYNEDEENEDLSFGKSKPNFMKTANVSEEKNPSLSADKKDSAIRPKPRTSKLLSDENDDNSYHDLPSSKFLKTIKPYENDKNDFSMKPKSKHTNSKPYPEEEEDDSLSVKPVPSSRFMKGSNVSDSSVKPKSNFSAKSGGKNSSFHLDPSEDDDDMGTGKSNSQFLKTTKIPDVMGKEKSDLRPKPRNSKSVFQNDESDDDHLEGKPWSSFRAKEPEKVHSDKQREKSDNSRDSKFNFYPRDDENDFPKSKSHKSYGDIDKKNDHADIFPKPQKRESKTINNHEDEDQMFRSSRSPTDETSKPWRGDSIMKPRKDTDDIFTKSSLRNREHEPEQDFKRRSIRFEDEDKNESGQSSRDQSPKKPNREKSEKNRSRSPSPVTSVCDEFEKDPVKQKLEFLKQRRAERARKEETSNMNTEHRIAVEAIHAVEDTQAQPEHPTTQKKKTTVPLNKKYQNIPSKITTKPNMRSVSMDHLNDMLTRGEQPNSDRNYSASQAIREAAYNDWYKAKLKEQKEKKKDVPVEEKETKEKRNEDDVKATYDAWLAKKKEYFSELKKKKEDEQKKQGENKENKDSKDNNFEMWKKLKDESKKKEIEKQKSEKEKSEKQKAKEAEEKKEELRKKKLEWEKRQSNDIKLKKLKEDEEKRKEEEKKTKANEKQMLAEISYRTWEEKMDENQQKLAIFSKRRESLVQTRRAWRPSSNTIATGK